QVGQFDAPLYGEEVVRRHRDRVEVLAAVGVPPGADAAGHVFKRQLWNLAALGAVTDLLLDELFDRRELLPGRGRRVGVLGLGVLGVGLGGVGLDPAGVFGLGLIGVGVAPGLFGSSLLRSGVALGLLGVVFGLFGLRFGRSLVVLGYAVRCFVRYAVLLVGALSPGVVGGGGV